MKEDKNLKNKKDASEEIKDEIIENAGSSNAETTEDTETIKGQEECGVDFDSLSFDETIAMIKELSADNKKLSDDLEKSSAETLKFKDNWYRTAAEFENFKKRNEFTRRNAYEDGIKDALLPILNIGDSIDRALAVELDEKTKNGVMLIKRQFVESLAALKVEEIDSSDGVFDPASAEAIATLPTDDEAKNGTIAQVYKKGYSLNGKILRYAQVVVYKFNG